MSTIGIIISTGRCGTTSIAHHLERLDVPGLRVYHERLKQDVTRPVEFFRAYEAERMDELARRPGVRELLAELGQLGANDTYIETGWTAYPLIPLLINRFPRQVRIIHLTRHPVSAAASVTLHGLYDDRTDSDFQRDESFVVPWSTGVVHRELESRWRQMSPFERNLFRVGEINLFGLELAERYPEVAMLRLRLEDFSATTGEEICQFFGIAGGEKAKQPLPRANSTKRFARGARGIGNDWRRAVDYPWVAEVADQLGYEMSQRAIVNMEAKMRSYNPTGWLEHLVNVAYRIGPVRRQWRKQVTRRRLQRRARRGDA